MHIFVAGCGDGAHAFTGRLYDPSNECLGNPVTLDVVAGGEPGQCDAKCITQRAGDAGTLVYITNMCPPLPSGPSFDVSGDNPACSPALAAAARGKTCGDSKTKTERNDAGS